VEALRTFLERYTKLTDPEWDIIRSCFEEKVFRKNELILEEGKVCRHFWFLEEGLVRYFILRDGNEVTRFFTAAPYCFTSKDSFRQRIPAMENIQALERTLTWQITLENSNKLLEVKAWEIFTRNFLHEVQSQMEELLFEITTETAENRYLKLLGRYPDLVNKIPLKHLSGFLGIAPQSLSRIRRKINNR